MQSLICACFSEGKGAALDGRVLVSRQVKSSTHGRLKAADNEEDWIH